MVAIGIAFLPVFARLTRASFLEFRDRDFVVAARALGAGDRALIGRHILPNTLPPLIVQATISFPVAILAEAGLSYLGLGTQPPNPSWGLMLKEAQGFLTLNPWYAIFPGGAIALTVLGLHALQHRGQEASGIVTCNGQHFHAHRALGHVGDTSEGVDEGQVREREGHGVHREVAP